ncbi:unnamed protein product [Sphenostylis stenocarpa]|uniref:Uncharacterized protein n=1 Tax=Sphenostylis stenocarpa TaxID=92480 RepID=A0AA86SDZ2_9FABA|nr:unnamed protein product [Sphenostylis stenocarpa]
MEPEITWRLSKGERGEFKSYLDTQDVRRRLGQPRSGRRFSRRQPSPPPPPHFSSATALSSPPLDSSSAPLKIRAQTRRRRSQKTRVHKSQPHHAALLERSHVSKWRQPRWLRGFFFESGMDEMAFTRRLWHLSPFRYCLASVGFTILPLPEPLCGVVVSVYFLSSFLEVRVEGGCKSKIRVVNTLIHRMESVRGARLNDSSSSSSYSSHIFSSLHLTKRPFLQRAILSLVANPSETVTTRKSRRKKTLSELKEEEDLLLKERRSLKKELASLRVTVEKHKTTNESLKRMKLDFVSRQNSSGAAAASEVCGKAVNDPSQFATSECHPSDSVSRNTVIHDVSPVCAANASPKAQGNGNQESTFVLPDLNLPVDEDFSANAIH